MTTLELYRAGKLREAIQSLGGELRSNPLDAKRRTFLFELLLFTGEWDRAEKQLDLLAEANAQAAAGTLLYRSALHAERIRQAMFAAGEAPEPKEAAPRLCRWNGKPVASVSDTDPRIGASVEVFLAGSYTWIPIRFLRRVEVLPPVNLRDLVWARGTLETTEDFRLQEIGEVLFPALCPLTPRHADEPVQLGRECAWEADERFGEIPYGPKLIAIDGEEIPLLRAGKLEWPAAEKEQSDAPA